MSLKIIYINIIAYCICLQISAQDNPISNIIPPSPNASQLGKFGDIPVNGYTGAAILSIPLFTIIERDLKIPVYLTYSSNGVKPREEPSWVGTDWNLHAGGVITRSVQHIPDERWSLNGFIDSRTDEPGEILNGNESRTFQNNTYLVQPDMSPDIFYFNFMGYSGKFYKNNARSGDVLYEIVPHQNFKIDVYYASGGGSHLTKITIIDDKGITYEFGFESDYGDLSEETRGGIEYSNPKGGMLDNTVTAWYLTKVTSPSGAEINLNYKRLEGTTRISHETYYYNEKKTALKHVGGTISPCVLGGGTGSAILDVLNNKSCVWENIFKRSTWGAYTASNTLSWSVSDEPIRTIIYPSYLTSITTSDEIVYFTSVDHPSIYSLSPYKNNVKRLTQIVRMPYNELNTIYYRFDYWSNTSRLMLKSIQQSVSGMPTIPPYEFEYHHYGMMPGSLTTKVDHWGYYNGNINNTGSLRPSITTLNGEAHYSSREPNPAVCDYNMLKKVTYPTGGFSEFTYKAHEYNYIGKFNDKRIKPYSVSQSTAGGARVSQIKHSGLNNDQVINYTYYDGILYAKPEYLNIAFFTNGTTDLEYWEHRNNSYNFLGYNPVTYRRVRETYADKSYKETTYKSLFERCDRIIHPINDDGTLVTTHQPPFHAITSYEALRGMETKVSYFNSSGKPEKEISNDYQTVTDRPIEAFKISPFPRIIADESGVSVGRAFNPSHYRVICRDYKLHNQTTREFYPNGSISSQTSYNYNLDSWESNQNITLLSSTTTKNSKNQTITTRFKYPHEYVTLLDDMEVEEDLVLRDCDSERSACLHESTSIYKRCPYDECNNVPLCVDNVCENTYASRNNACESSYNSCVSYNNNLKEQGELIKLQRDWAIYKLVERNIISKPIESQTLLREGAKDYLMEGTLTEYKEFHGIVKPKRVYTIKTDEPLSNITQSSLNSSGELVFNSAYTDNPDICIDDYDANGNLLMYHERNNANKYNSYIWGYNNSYPIAKTINARSSEIVYNGFENEGFNPARISARGIAKTGNYSTKACYIDWAHNTTVYLIGGKDYVVSYWTKAGTSDSYSRVSIYNPDLNFDEHITITPPSNGEWVYKEETISVNTSAMYFVCILSHYGSGTNTDLSKYHYIDDLRVHPSDAQMNTYTYNPFTDNITSHSNERGQATTYYYDGFGRLLYIKDNEGNITNDYEYHYK